MFIYYKLLPQNRKTILACSVYVIHNTFISFFSYLCTHARPNYSYSGVTHVDKSDPTPNFQAAESETINSPLSHAVTLEESLLFHLSCGAFARSHPSSPVIFIIPADQSIRPPQQHANTPSTGACLGLGVFVKLLSYHRAPASVLKSIF